MDGFDHAVAIVLEREGVLSDHPADDGGLTKYGISQRAYPHLDIRNLTIDQAIEIYRRDFWDRCRCGRLPWPFALALFDGAVNHGPGLAARLMQKAVHAPADGIVGPFTIGRIQRAGDDELADYFARRGVLYGNHPDWRTMGLGWMRRIFLIHREAID
ncbi:MAG TPA: glycosyl hydrolase 108 family protein [Longimicrobiales bacterium]|jgi:lysozyme family protein